MCVISVGSALAVVSARTGNKVPKQAPMDGELVFSPHYFVKTTMTMTVAFYIGRLFS